MTVGAIGGLAGCSDGESTDTIDDESTSTTESSTTVPKALSDVKSAVERIYARLNAVPLAEGEELVFDLSAFEEEFDHHGVMDLAEETLEELNRIGDRADVDDDTVEALTQATRIGDHLARQRFFLHQALSAGGIYDQRISTGEYDAATEAIRYAREFVDGLADSGEVIEHELSTIERNADVAIDGFDTASIALTQDALVEITQWLAPVYEGFHHMVRALSIIDRDDPMPEDDEIRRQKQRYETVLEHLEDAQSAFDTAHGRGKELPRFVPRVEEFRCALPDWLDGYATIRDGFETVDAGDENEGQEQVVDGLETIRKPAERCEL